MSFANTLASMQPSRMLERASREMTSAIRHLSTDVAVERAADNPSAFIAGEHLKSDIDRLYAEGNSEQREYYVAAYTEGVRGVANELLQALKGNVSTLANKSGLGDAEKESLQLSNDSILDALDRLGQTASINGNLAFEPDEEGNSALSGSRLSRTRDEQSGETYTLADLRSGGLLANGVGGEVADKLVSQAISANNTERSALGNQMRQIEVMGSVRGIAIENMQSALSQLIDTDYAEEMTRLVRSQTLQAGALAAQAIATRQNQAVLRLMQ